MPNRVMLWFGRSERGGDRQPTHATVMRLESVIEDLGWRSSRVAVIKLATDMCWRSACYQTACGNVLISLLSLSNCLWKCEEDQLAILVKLAMEIRWRSACYQTACGNVLISLLWSSNCLWKCVHLLRFQFLLFKSAVLRTAWIDKHEFNSRRPDY